MLYVAHAHACMCELLSAPEAAALLLTRVRVEVYFRKALADACPSKAYCTDPYVDEICEPQFIGLGRRQEKLIRHGAKPKLCLERYSELV
jgi:hypothetical protein